ncbi:dihydrofolate reductase family protein [Nonomuraea sp. NPDC050663]|uniref:dihydrofolate reductase family protein n=1 Tax=Nonomuraea sp. NPDC050663 TaxID=3364370 RepID=UPI0037A2292C
MRLTVTTFTTLDGIAQSPGAPDEDPSGGFTHGGWVAPYADEEFGKTVGDWFTDAGAFLFGRVTYEAMAAYWSQAADESDVVTRAFNTLPKYVASRGRPVLDWAGSRLIEGDVARAVAGLKAEPGGELQVHGSLGLVQTLVKSGLVDEFRLLVAPVVIGSGKRLFDDVVPTRLELVDSRSTGAGVMIQVYLPERA